MPADAASSSRDAQGRVQPPPRAYTVLFDLIVNTKLLDAVDVVSLGSCCRELRAAAVAFWWRGARGGKAPTVFLKSVEKLVAKNTHTNADAHPNKARYLQYVNVESADKCTVCRILTRFYHPILETWLCARCGDESDYAPFSSKFYRYRLVSSEEARARYGLKSSVDLGKHLTFFERPTRSGYDDYHYNHYNSTHNDREVGRNDREKLYAPSVATNVRAALGSSRASASPSYHPSSSRVQLFRLRDVACLMLEKFGGPTLLQERICHLALPPLDLDDRNA